MIINSFEPKPDENFEDPYLAPSRHRGDHAFPDPGKYQSLKCGICGTEMDVRRNVHGPTSFAAAMAKKGRDHDAFYCPHIKADWHVQAKKLLDEIRATPSDSLAKIMHAELCHIVQTREATKKVSNF
jgi:hypothetical protein